MHIGVGEKVDEYGRLYVAPTRNGYVLSLLTEEQYEANKDANNKFTFTPPYRAAGPYRIVFYSKDLHVLIPMEQLRRLLDNRQEIEPKQKKCSVCGQQKATRVFYKNRGQKDGRDNLCSLCRRKLNKETYAARKEENKS